MGHREIGFAVSSRMVLWDDGSESWYLWNGTSGELALWVKDYVGSHSSSCSVSSSDFGSICAKVY